MAKMVFCEALGKILSDRSLREAFLRDPNDCASRLSLQSQDVPAFIRMSTDEIQRQAQTLLKKRFHEVSKWLPATISRLGAAAWTDFRDYAELEWPQGHNRHLRDAIGFGEHLQRSRRRELSTREFHRLRFRDSSQKLRLGFSLHWDFATRRHFGFQVLRRLKNGKISEFLLVL